MHGVILYLLTDQTKYEASLETVAKFFGNKDVHDSVYVDMYECEEYEGFLKSMAVHNLARAENSSKEYDSIISTGNSQLSTFMGFRKGILSKSDFSLTDLKQEPTTIYLVLPAGKMGSHFRWLRMMVTLSLAILERQSTKPEYPVLFVLEEFAALGYMRPIERAAGYMAGFGVKLWPILQDLQQLKTHYPNSWQTFLGNAGMLQVFGLNDGTTEEFISKRLGTTQYEDEEPMHPIKGDLINPPVKRIGRLLEPHEVRLLFSRETARQIIIFPQFSPIALMRLAYDN